MSEENKSIEVELSEARAMVYIPEGSVELEINATVYENGELIKVGKTMTLKEIQEALRDAEENYISDDDKFVVTENGIEWLDRLHKND